MTRASNVSFLVLTALVAGCSGAGVPTVEGAGTAAGPEPTVTAAPPIQGEGPCALLADAVVQRLFPGTKAGHLDRRHEKEGVLRCEWNHPTGLLSIIPSTDKPQPVEAEARGWTLIFLDPLNDGASRHVRYERLPGVGDEAIAIVERADPDKGFIRDGAVLVVQRGSRQVTLLASGLARRERAEALNVLEQLGRAVASRLE